MKLQIKDSSMTREFEYKGENPELLESALARVLNETELKRNDQDFSSVLLGERTFFCSKRSCRQLRQVIRDPAHFILAESVLARAKAGSWQDLLSEVDRSDFKFVVRYVWKYVDLPLENWLLECLRSDRNGGLSVESVLARVLDSKVVYRFAEIRDGLGHLCKLGLADHQSGMFSARYGLLEA